MAWYNSTGKENHPSLYETRVVDRCLFCGDQKEIKTTMTIYFSEFETNTGPICKSCYSANAKQAKATWPGKHCSGYVDNGIDFTTVN